MNLTIHISFPFFINCNIFYQTAKVESCCGGNKENIENKNGNVVLDGNNKLGLEDDDNNEIGNDDDDEEEEDRINNEYVLYDEDQASDGEFDEDAEGGEQLN